jgi:predicted TIM-barrel fold metal-dependent hydrolase
MFPSLVRFAGRFAKLRIVINHLPLDWPADSVAPRAALRELRNCPNVFAKVSGVLRRMDGRTPADVAFYRESLDELWTIFGPGRVIYGSNWPVCEKVAPYADVQKVVMEYFAAKGTDAVERYFWKNSLTAYRWKPAG